MDVIYIPGDFKDNFGGHYFGLYLGSLLSN